MTAPSPQIIAADPRLTVFVTANAGSGKTTTLVNRVARLLLDQVDPGAILCVTYTKAAAAEMQARLFDQLGGWAVLDDAALSRELARLDDGDPQTMDHAALSRARKLFARALETPGGLKIQTIHAFCEKLLRRFPLEAGVSPRFTVLEDQAATALSEAARKELAQTAYDNPDGLIGLAYSHFAVELDWQRFQALLSMIEAKRADLLDYIDRAEAGTAPDPYALTGAEAGRSPEELEQDFVAWIDPAEWNRMAEAMATGSTNDRKIADAMSVAAPPYAGFAALAGVFCTQAGEPRKSMGTKSAPQGAVGWLVDLQTQFLATREALRKARIADDTIKVLTLARAHAAFYEAAKAQRGALDFPDLVARAAALLTRSGAAAWVLYKLDGGVDHVLIDEAQDTAPEQWAIVRALTGEFYSGQGSPHRASGRTVFAVGDEKQSIYSFQGARPERLRQERADFLALAEGAGEPFAGPELNTSYRSTEEVLTFVDAVFADPDRTRALTGPQGDIARHIPARIGQHGAIDLWPLFLDEPAPETDAWDDPVDQESAGSARKRLARDLAREIRRQVESGLAVFDSRTRDLRPAGYGDYIVLVRRRDATFEEIIRALKTEGVPVAGADRLKLSSHIVFDDLIALARFALFPDDDLSLAEVLRSPLCDVDENGLYALAGRENRKAGQLWRDLRDRAHERPEWTRARDLLQAVIGARGGDPFAFFSLALNRVDDTGRSGRARILARLGREAEEAIDETLNQVLAAENRGAIDLEACLAQLEAADVEVKRELEGARGEVRVMTVHGAKGLEAPIVILPDTTMKAKAQGPSLMPAVPRSENGEDEGEAWLMAPGSAKDDCPASADARAARQARTDDETLRLLYVALTRARDRVIVMGRASSRGAEPGSWWSVIEETFDRLGDQVREVENGVRRFGVDPERRPVATAQDRTTAALPAWAATPPSADAAARFAAPSRMEGAIRIPAPSPLARSAAGGAALGRFRRGDLIHRLLERLPEIAPADRPDAARRLLARETDLDEAQRAEMIAAAFSVLDDARFAPVFGPGSRAEVALTGALPGPSSVAINGRIDRLVVTPDRVLVIDYKTNRPAPDALDRVDPAYVLQAAVYVAVLKRLYPDRPVEAALVWTDGPKLMPIPQAMLDAALTP
ncbi:double-strand break repair helicase AddA [Brevundimonas sp. SL130]|uniref:double-strand break repair helicase AddA n=1 Tax=Brevundimonas sp. SL130 TaxID=2995143 RepID=UPI00226CE22A|nr:double-strand break repair helicase AddA [Brevundimonas sp. SL130]WAC59558.1 double-strand break repair helicase AddA [Brevundimonas sp. SL130]